MQAVLKVVRGLDILGEVGPLFISEDGGRAVLKVVRGLGILGEVGRVRGSRESKIYSGNEQICA
ncbi:hypothetical protein J6590_002612 [Homalodisca vitripennis]|nr:hypothetical protein J6590_002612 [Homalodisca vitripennis]